MRPLPLLPRLIQLALVVGFVTAPAGLTSAQPVPVTTLATPANVEAEIARWAKRFPPEGVTVPGSDELKLSAFEGVPWSTPATQVNAKLGAKFARAGAGAFMGKVAGRAGCTITPRFSQGRLSHIVVRVPGPTKGSAYDWAEKLADQAIRHYTRDAYATNGTAHLEPGTSAQARFITQYPIDVDHDKTRANFAKQDAEKALLARDFDAGALWLAWDVVYKDKNRLRVLATRKEGWLVMGRP